MSEPAVLDTKVGHPSPDRSRLSGWRVGVPLVLSPLLFAGQVVASFTIADSACTRSAAPATTLLVFNVAMFALLLLLLLLSVANRRTVGNENSASLKDLHDQGDGRTAFLIQFGLSMSALFVAVSLLELVAIAFLGACVGFSPSV